AVVQRDRPARLDPHRHRQVAPGGGARPPALRAGQQPGRRSNGEVMTGDVRELLPLYALGILEADEIGVVERAVASDAGLAAELASFQATSDAVRTVIEVAPAPEVMRRLMASVGGGRFDSFAERLARIFDVTSDRAREFLGLIERPASWIPQVVPGIFFVHFE